MAATREHLEAFAPLTWATYFLTSPSWVTRERTRGSLPGDDVDRFCRDTMLANNGVQKWLELYEKPGPGEKVTRTVSLCKFGPGLFGFPGIAHGGALLTIMDEALAYVMVANEILEHGVEFVNLGEDTWKRLLSERKDPSSVLAGRLVTAKMDVKFLKPVQCPGVVGIEVNTLENTGRKMSMRGVMRDGNGTPLLQIDGVWVRIGGATKL